MNERVRGRESLMCDPGCWYLPSVNQFPFATQKVPLSLEYFDLAGGEGWILLVLPPSYAQAFVDRTPDGQGWTQRPYMGWTGLVLNYGTYTAGSEGATLANAHCFPMQSLPDLGVSAGMTPIR